MRILHIISGLNQGGAESVLYSLCLNTDKSDTEHIVVSLTTNGVYGKQLESIGTKVHCLDIKKRYLFISAVFRLYKLIRLYNPSVVQTWMYHADLVGGLVARIAGCKNIIWNIRGPLNKKNTGLFLYLVARICAVLSRFIPAHIISCSQHARERHTKIGYINSKFLIIPNGYEVNSRLDLRSELHDVVSEYSLKSVIGMVARFDPYKDHENLLRALRILKDRRTNFSCYLIGAGMEGSNARLVSLIDSYGLSDFIILKGPLMDVNQILPKLDLHVLSSLDEAFPNVIAEAMACGVPCVTTDVGDAALIVGQTGWVVSAKDSLALADAIEEALEEKSSPTWNVRKQKCVMRIKNNFSMEKMLEGYQKVWAFSL
jgi:glycosyltransferase involved in cell wall biosynthesis